jgi:hypothetical protein
MGLCTFLAADLPDDSLGRSGKWEGLDGPVRCAPISSGLALRLSIHSLLL